MDEGKEIADAAAQANEEASTAAYEGGPREVCGYIVHPALAAFPVLSEGERVDLQADIVRNGMLEPIKLDRDRRLLDGRARLEIARDLGETAHEEIVCGPEEAASYVISLNLHRRHLTESQRAIVAARLATIPHGGARQGEDAPAARGEVTQRTAAKLVRVSRRSVQKAREVLDSCDEKLIEGVSSGRMTVSAAHATLSRRKARERFSGEPIPLPDGPFDVVEADPAWRYEDARNLDTSNGTTEKHYDTMTAEEIAAMPVSSIVADDAVLFLWTTNGHLVDGSATMVARAWGFEPKTLLTWCKSKIGTGDWARGQTEHVVIASRGKMPAWWETIGSTILPRGESREHSRKPEEFYTFLERLIPRGVPKVMLFARGPRDGWNVWGAESDKFKESVQQLPLVGQEG